MHEKIEEMMAKTEEIKKMKETMLSWVQQEVNSGKECVHVESTGQVVDMIKDLAETEKECAESLYYMVVVDAMLNGKEPEYGEPMGYNHRHLNNGRFARSGSGHVVGGGTSGFHPGPFVDQDPYIDGYLHNPEDFWRTMNKHPNTMGYDDEHGRWKDSDGQKSKYGRAYDDYLEARRHYTVSKNASDKERMDHHTMEHVMNGLESMQEMWAASDDAMLKKRIVEEASKVIDRMKTSMGISK